MGGAQAPLLTPGSISLQRGHVTPPCRLPDDLSPPQVFRWPELSGEPPGFSESERVAVARPCRSGASLPSRPLLLPLDCGLGRTPPLPLSMPRTLLLPSMPFLSPSSICCLKPTFWGLLVPQIGCTRRGFCVPHPGTSWPACLCPPQLLCPPPLSPDLHSVHVFSVFCPRGKARLSAASCLTLLHLRPPSGALVGGGVEPVETVSRPHSQAGGTSPDPGL